MQLSATMLARFALALVCSPIAALAASAAEDLAPISLPPPQMDGGLPLMRALKLRQSKRDFLTRELAPQVLSELLWAAWGVNRPENDHRTAPSGMNAQEIDLYVALPGGVFVYDAKAHRLNPVGAEDLRAKTGGQDFVKVAPVALIFVADHGRMVKAKPEVKEPYSWNDAGYISQNVYLYCASAGLATVVHEVGDRRPLSEALRLRPEQKIILAQAVGYPDPNPPPKKAKKK
jgi:nitroreductase